MLRAFADQGNARSLVGLDLDRCESLSEDCLYKFILRFGSQLRGLILSGIPHVTDQLWAGVLPSLKQLKILVMGMPEGCCPKIHQKVTGDLMSRHHVHLVSAVPNRPRKTNIAIKKKRRRSLNHNSKVFSKRRALLPLYPISVNR